MVREKLGVFGLWDWGSGTQEGGSGPIDSGHTAINPLPTLPNLRQSLRCSFPARGWGQPGGNPEPRKSPRVGGPHSLAVKQPENRGPQPRRCLYGALSYQLPASRRLGWGLSGPLSCFVAKGAQHPGQRRSPCPASGPGGSSADRSSGGPPGLPPQVPSPVPRDPGLSAGLPPISSPHLSCLRGHRDLPVQLESPCTLCLDLAYLGLCSRNLPTRSDLLQSHPTPTPTSKGLSLLAMPPSPRTPV